MVRGRLLRTCLSVALLAVLAGGSRLPAAEPAAVDFNTHAAPLLRKYCLACHDAKEANGDLVLESFASLMKGGGQGRPVVPGEPDKSLLVRVMEKSAEPVMPPEGSLAPSNAEIAQLRAWIAAGAKPPTVDLPVAKLATPKIALKRPARNSVYSLASSPDGRFLAIGRYGAVEVQEAATGNPVRRLEGLTGPVNDLVFSSNSATLAAASGETGLSGEVSLWKVGSWEKPLTWKGHADSLYAIALSPDGRTVATGSYDQKIMLWSAADGRLQKTLEGHNGAVNDLDFHPSGSLLASASSDRTVKLWNVTTGERLDTFSQPEKEQNVVLFSRNGGLVLAGGADNRLRIWELREMGREGTSPLIQSRFAHEAPILKIVAAADGRLLATAGEDGALKFWETEQFTPVKVLKEKSDWVSGLTLLANGSSLVVGRLDGTLSRVPLQEIAGLKVQSVQPIRTTQVPEVPLSQPAPKLNEWTEAEPNDLPAKATKLTLPAVVNGVLQASEGNRPDVDLYRIEARKGDVWILETNAQRQKSPADTRIEVLDENGKPVLRHLLQAVRASYIEFRPIDSSQDQVRVKNWEEMDLNQFLYMDGEIGKFLKAPEGPDSGYWFYTIGGKRRCYFDTSPTIHALDSTCYIVEAYPPGTVLVDNGLPIFPLDYSNDDDSERKLGSDSRLTFTAPNDGAYLVRVTDARGFQGKEFLYSLTVRPPRPDFQVTIGGKGATVGKGSGQRLTFTVDRIDSFEGEVRIDISNLPPGWTTATPVVVQPGHVEARGVLHAAAEAPTATKEQWEQVKVTATATIAGEPVVRDLGSLGEIKLADRPKLLVSLQTDPQATNPPSSADNVPEIVITPGQRTTALVRIERHGASGDLRFDVDNLPHGVIVDDLGLNGITLLPGQTERRIFIAARDWVPETTRLVYAICRSEGNQASLPIRFRVLPRPETKTAATSKPTP